MISPKLRLARFTSTSWQSYHLHDIQRAHKYKTHSRTDSQRDRQTDSTVLSPVMSPKLGLARFTSTSWQSYHLHDIQRAHKYKTIQTHKLHVFCHNLWMSVSLNLNFGQLNVAWGIHLLEFLYSRMFCVILQLHYYIMHYYYYIVHTLDGVQLKDRRDLQIWCFVWMKP